MIFGFTLEVEKQATPTKIVHANFELGTFRLLFAHMARRAYSREDMQEEITENMHRCDGTTLRVCEFGIKCSTRAEKRWTGKLFVDRM